MDLNVLAAFLGLVGLPVLCLGFAVWIYTHMEGGPGGITVATSRQLRAVGPAPPDAATEPERCSPVPVLQYRQGDVLLVAAELPRFLDGGWKQAESGVLAEGEATGHAHRADLDHAHVWVNLAGQLYVVNREAATVTHEEHAPITLPPGAWRVVRQQEYDPRSDRYVAD